MDHENDVVLRLDVNAMGQRFSQAIITRSQEIERIIGAELGKLVADGLDAIVRDELRRMVREHVANAVNAPDTALVVYTAVRKVVRRIFQDVKEDA